MKKILIVNARVLPCEGPDIDCGFVLAAEGKIAALGSMEDCPAHADVHIDAAGGTVIPGLVDGPIWACTKTASVLRARTATRTQTLQCRTCASSMR